MVAIITSVIYSLYAVKLVSWSPEISSMDMKQPVKITPMGLFTASSATGMPLNPVLGRD